MDIQRRGAPEEIGAWIAWLAGPASQWVTGQVIAVERGRYVKLPFVHTPA